MATNNKVNIAGLSKTELLRKLWERSTPASFFTMSGIPAPKLSEKELEKSVTGYVDYLSGRVIKCDLTEDTAYPQMYDRDNGIGAFQSVVDKMRQSNT